MSVLSCRTIASPVTVSTPLPARPTSRLDTREGAVAEVIVPGKPEASELIKPASNQSDPDEVMPNPDDSHKKPLSHGGNVRDLEQRGSAKESAWGEHWAFVATRRKDRIIEGPDAHPIDHFVAQSAWKIARPQNVAAGSRGSHNPEAPDWPSTSPDCRPRIEQIETGLRPD